MKTNRREDNLREFIHQQSSQRFYHGTKANLVPGELVEPGFNSNYGKKKKAHYVYLTAPCMLLPGGAELAGEGSGRIYIGKCKN